MKKSALKFLSFLSLIPLIGSPSLLMVNHQVVYDQVSDSNKKVKAVDGRIFPDHYKSIYHTQFNEPVISVNPDNPGYLGVVQPIGGTSEFPSQITWMGNNLYHSWSHDVSFHPDILKYQTTNDQFVKPIVLGAHNLDDSSQINNFSNEIMIIVGDENDLQARKYAFIRYNTLTGLPVVNPNNQTVIVPSTSNSPIPNATSQSVFAIAYHKQLKQYIVYYPGSFINVKNDLFMFSINNNVLNFHNNQSPNLAGIKKWPASDSNHFYNDQNTLLSISGSINNEWAVMIRINRRIPFIRARITAINLNADFSPIDNWITIDHAEYARASNKYEFDETTEIDGYLYPIDDNFITYLNPNAYTIEGENQTTSIYMIFPIVISGNQLRYIKPTFNLSQKATGRYYSEAFGKYLSISNLLTTPTADPSKRHRATIWVNKKNSNEAIITYQTNANLTWLSRKFYFSSTLTNVPSKISKAYNLKENNYLSSSIQPWNSITVEDYFNPNLYLFSGATNLATLTYYENDGTISHEIISTSSGGISYINPLVSSEINGYYSLGENVKKPSEINLGSTEVDEGLLIYTGPLTNDLKDPGWNQKYLISRNINNLNLNFGVINSIPVNIKENIIRDDDNGILKGHLEITISPSIETKSFDLKSRLPVEVNNLSGSKLPIIPEEEIGSNLAGIIGGSIGGVIFLTVLMGIGLVVFLHKNKRLKLNENHSSSSDDQGVTSQRRPPSFPKTPTMGNQSKMTRNIPLVPAPFASSDLASKNRIMETNQSRPLTNQSFSSYSGQHYHNEIAKNYPKIPDQTFNRNMMKPSVPKPINSNYPVFKTDHNRLSDTISKRTRPSVPAPIHTKN
ncbi:MAG: hypothetical protein ACRCVI_03120 [Mycoplasmoidaceae bacterium]